MANNSEVVYRLAILDYVIIAAVPVMSMAIGLYYAWRSRKFKTVREFLVATSNLGVLPLVASALATIVTPRLVLGLPPEGYCNGTQMLLFYLSNFISGLFSIYAIYPVLYRMKADTVYQYIEHRFNRGLRITQALVFVLQNSILVASLVSLTVRIMSDATGMSYWTTMAVICGACAMYTSIGGFTGVVWTDVLQGLVIVASLLALVIKGTMNAGGMTEVWKKNAEGNRTITFRMSPDNESNYSFWCLVFGGFAAGMGYSVSQSVFQRQMANRTERKATVTMVSTKVGIFIVQIILTWTGMITYARYKGCDPLLNKQIHSRDQITVLYAMELFNDNMGLVGLFVAGILAASLSTLSSVVNSFSTVVVVDLINLFFPNLRQTTVMLLSKISGLAYGCLIVVATLIVDQIGSVVQVTFVVNGATFGPIAGVFMLGVFCPWATTKGAFTGLVSALVLIWWMAIGRLLNRVPYIALPLSTEECSAPYGVNLVNTTNFGIISSTASTRIDNGTSVVASALANNVTKNASHDYNAEEVLAIYQVNTIWYTLIAMSAVVVVGTVVSLVTGPQDPEKINPKLISPFSWAIIKSLPVGIRNAIGFRSKNIHADIQLSFMTVGEVKEGVTRNDDVAKNEPLIERVDT